MRQGIYPGTDSHAEVTEVAVISWSLRHSLKLGTNHIKLEWFPGNGNHSCGAVIDGRTLGSILDWPVKASESFLLWVAVGQAKGCEPQALGLPLGQEKGGCGGGGGQYLLARRSSEGHMLDPGISWDSPGMQPCRARLSSMSVAFFPGSLMMANVLRG